MKEEYTPAEADILLLSLPSVGLRSADMGASTEQEGSGAPGGIGGGYNPDGWT